jgi:nitroreductase
MPDISPSTLLEHLNWRYAAKRFDPNRKIPAETLNTLEQAVSLAPSSYGLQPWKFLVIVDPAVRETLRAASHNQPQITEASHLFVFCVRKNLGAEHIDRHLQRVADVRGVAKESLDGFRNVLIGDIVEGPRSLIVNQWSQRQLYIALGMLLTSAALLNVDACPMEGFEAAKYDQILGLGKKGLSATVLCALGYRSPEDKMAAAKKVRFDLEDVIERI